MLLEFGLNLCWQLSLSFCERLCYKLPEELGVEPVSWCQLASNQVNTDCSVLMRAQERLTHRRGSHVTCIHEVVNVDLLEVALALNKVGLHCDLFDFSVVGLNRFGPN